MDEPLASLDEARKAEILPYIERLRDEARRADRLCQPRRSPRWRGSPPTVVAADRRPGRAQRARRPRCWRGSTSCPLAGARRGRRVLDRARRRPRRRLRPDVLAPRRRRWLRAAARGAARRAGARADPGARRDARDPPARGDQRAERPGSPLPRGPRRTASQVEATLAVGGDRLLARITRRSLWALASRPAAPASPWSRPSRSAAATSGVFEERDA